MFVELLNTENRSAVFSSFFAETMTALVEVFGKSSGEAEALIDQLRMRFADAPSSEQNWLLHDDPVALASELAEVAWDQVDAQRLDAYNLKRRQTLPTVP